MKDTALILLASGLSQRFGSDKLCASLVGKPVIMHVVDTVLNLPFGGYYAVHNGDNMRYDLLRNAGFDMIENSSPKEGLKLSSALGAALAINDGFKRGLVMLADMPLVTAAHIHALMAVKGNVVMSESAGVKMPPALFSGAALKALRVPSDKGYKKTAITVPMPPNMAKDIDTPADLSMVEAILKDAQIHG